MPNPLRNTMADLITKVRLMINDPAGASQQFTDGQIQDALDSYVEVVRYLPLTIAPSIVNTASTNNLPSTIFADYYSEGYTWWEGDAVIQGQVLPSGASWKVLTPTSSDYLTGNWTFEVDVFNTGTIPGQMSPVFITGKCYDIYAASADLLEFWSATLVGAYDVTVDGQVLRRSQLPQAKLTMAQYYRRRSKPRIAHVSRSDVQAPLSAKRIHLLDEDDSYHGI